jgi:DNA-binding response OmpR family regulator
MTEEKTIMIMIVDDDPTIRIALRSMLKAEGFRIEEAADGAEALEKFKANPPALVLSDRMMPGLSGFELLRQLRALPSDVPFVFLTALTDARDRMSVADLGVAAYLEKPVTRDVLHACLRKILGKEGAA